MSDKIISIADDVKPKNIMTGAEATKLQSEAIAVLDRLDKEREDLRAQEIIIDGSNKVSFPGYPYTFTAVGEKILISVDIFKTGYECKICNGRKKLEIKCICEDTSDRPGYKYSTAMLEAFDQDNRKAREEIKCSECKGDYISARQTVKCSACKGKGAILLFADQSRKLPTTGRIVSIGNLARILIERDSWEYKLGDKVLFGEHVGEFIPTKAGILLKILDYNQVRLKVEGAGDLDAFDFIIDKED